MKHLLKTHHNPYRYNKGIYNIIYENLLINKLLNLQWLRGRENAVGVPIQVNTNGSKVCSHCTPALNYRLSNRRKEIHQQLKDYY
jgi:hypothetical protein